MQNNIAKEEVLEGKAIQVTPEVALVDKGETDIQVATAKRFPRSIKKFMSDALELATLDEETAASCMYGVPRGGKIIEGPSIKFADILVSCWGNMRVSARPVGQDDKFVHCTGMAWDMEKNVAFAAEVQRKITDKRGRRYNDDMIGTTTNAGSSVAMRNAVLHCIPKPAWKSIYDKVRMVAVGEAETLGAKRSALLDYFGKMGVLPERIFALLQVPGVEEITLDHLATLRALANAIKEGEAKVDESFPHVSSSPLSVTKTESIKDKLKKKANGENANG